MNVARPDWVFDREISRPASELSDLEIGIYSAIAYKDVFRFPITATEIHRYVQRHVCTLQDVEAALGGQAMDERLSTDGTYYVRAGRESWLSHPVRHTDLCLQAWRRARRYASMLAAIPTVKMVGVTGSLANNNVHPGDDIDFMVITDAGCLWRTRACTKVLQQLDVRFGSGQLCVNYLRSEAALSISDECLYMAQEITQMVPLYGMDVYAAFRDSNGWTRDFLPNAARPPPIIDDYQVTATPLRKLAGPLMTSGLAKRIELWEQNRKLGKYNDTNFLPGDYSRFSPEATGHRLSIRNAAQNAFECRMRNFRDTQRPLRLLFGQSYHLSFDKKLWDEMRPFPPLGCLYAVGVARHAGYETHFSDSMVATSTRSWGDALHRVSPDVAVLFEDNFNYLTKMCLSNMREAAVEMIGLARDQDIPVLICSSDATDNPDIYLDAGARFVILGEGEATLSDLLELLAEQDDQAAKELAGVVYRQENGDTVANPRRPPMRRIDSLPKPAWDLVDWQHYRSLWAGQRARFAVNIVTTRGCPYHCNWCAKPIWGQSYQARHPDNVANEIAQLITLASPDYVWMMDDIFGLKPGWISRFADALEQRGINLPFKCLSRPDILLREGEIDALARAGCDVVWMGAESGSQKVLDAMEKGTTVQQVEQATANLRKKGIRVGHFIQFGYPGEEISDIRQTLRLLRKTLPDELGISVSYPLPGTKFYDRVMAELGDKRNWVDSDDLAILFSSPYNTRFYRNLHRYTHNYVNFHRNLEALAKTIRLKALPDVAFAKTLIRLLITTPRLLVTWFGFRFFQHTENPQPTVLKAELSQQSAASPSIQPRDPD